MYTPARARITALHTRAYAIIIHCELSQLQVSIVFHVAATVRFDEKLKLATAINVQSTSDVIDLCKDMQKLKVRENPSRENLFAWPCDVRIPKRFFDTLCLVIALGMQLV